jgi:V/A-type H+-transporting ATPase subunit K
MFCAMMAFASVCLAAEETGQGTEAANPWAQSIRYLSAALSVGLCAIATGIAQSRIGAAGMGTIVEKPETTGTVIIMVAIPETMVILGFVVAAIIVIL